MIVAKAVLGVDGAIVRFEASGHSAQGGSGRDIVCSAFSVLARTAYESLSALPGVDLAGEAPNPGELWFSVRRMDPASAERAAGISDFLTAGISGLEREYPGQIRFTIERHWRE